jgi:hypothetical protein
MATVKRHSVIIKNYSNIFEEFIASEAITPGHLIELMTTGEIRKHTGSGGNVLPMFAVENELAGGGIDDAYAHEDPVSVWVPGRGSIVNALLADGQTIVIGDWLESAGNGTLTKSTADTWASANAGTIYGNNIVGQSIEAVNLSDSSDTHPVSGLRIKVRIV